MSRDIFKFTGGNKPTAVNLEHVVTMTLEEKRITFGFINGGMYLDMETEEQAKNVFDNLLNIWAGTGILLKDKLEPQVEVPNKDNNEEIFNGNS